MLLLAFLAFHNRIVRLAALMAAIIAFSCLANHKRDIVRNKWMCHFWAFIPLKRVHFCWLKSATICSTYSAPRHVLLFMPICHGFLIATWSDAWLPLFLLLLFCIVPTRWTLCTHTVHRLNRLNCSFAIRNFFHRSPESKDKAIVNFKPSNRKSHSKHEFQLWSDCLNSILNSRKSRNSLQIPANYSIKKVTNCWDFLYVSLVIDDS